MRAHPALLLPRPMFAAAVPFSPVPLRAAYRWTMDGQTDRPVRISLDDEDSGEAAPLPGEGAPHAAASAVADRP